MHNSENPRYRNNLLSAHGWMNKDAAYKCNGILFTHKIQEHPAICGNMDGLWGYHAKWNNSDTERQILCGITYMWNLK